MAPKTGLAEAPSPRPPHLANLSSAIRESGIAKKTRKFRDASIAFDQSVRWCRRPNRTDLCFDLLFTGPLALGGPPILAPCLKEWLELHGFASRAAGPATRQRFQRAWARTTNNREPDEQQK
jgi:hypothetical protein